MIINRAFFSIVIFFVVASLCLLGILNSASALFLGFTHTLLFNSPYPIKTKKSINYLLRAAVVGLGFGMLIEETLKTTQDGFTLTALSIVSTLLLGTLLAKLLKVDKRLAHLITSGTSICGGSAIAAISPIIRAEGKTISVALGVIFFLNSIALFVFPPLGHLLELSQEQFGLWCAIAIHDTSSVVGAALSFGDEALLVATAVKLSRVLWIIPLSFVSMLLFKPKGGKVKPPYFILGFIAAIIINSYGIIPSEFSTAAVLISKRLLVLTLFLVGTTLSIKDLKASGWKPMLFAAILWVFISIFSLVYISS